MAATCSIQPALSSADAVRRIFELQEERKAEYDKLKKSLATYTSSDNPLSSDTYTQFQSQTSSITSNLTSISKEFEKVGKLLNDRGLMQASDIVGTMQRMENDKLKLIVEYQITERKAKSHDDDDIVIESINTIRWIPELRELRKKLAKSDGDISSKLEELRFECEELLLS